jgi:GNAT superfamily N-acetyltransferase
MIWKFEGNIEIDTEKARIPIESLYAFLQTTYWAKQRSLATTELSVQNSLCFGIHYNLQFIGFARLITDYAVFAYLCDVFILPEYQAKGYGKLLMQTLHAYPDLQNVRHWILATQDAHGLYEQFGYTSLENPSRWMEICKPQY